MSGRRSAPSLPLFGGLLHQFNRRSIRIAHVNDTFASVRARFQCLRFAGGFPTGRGDSFQHSLKVIDDQRHVNMSDITRFAIDMVSISRREVLKQLDLVTARRFHNSKLEFSAFHSRNFFRHLTYLMRAMRKFEPEHIAPKFQRPFEIRDGNASVIGRENAKSLTRVHARNRNRFKSKTSNLQRSTFNFHESSHCGGISAAIKSSSGESDPGQLSMRLRAL
jgi:hypothetical protein